jgi:hypothetical protein
MYSTKVEIERGPRAHFGTLPRTNPGCPGEPLVIRHYIIAAQALASE